MTNLNNNQNQALIKELQKLQQQLKEAKNEIGNLQVKLGVSERLLALEKGKIDEFHNQTNDWCNKFNTNLDLLREAKRKIRQLEKEKKAANQTPNKENLENEKLEAKIEVVVHLTKVHKY